MLRELIWKERKFVFKLSILFALIFMSNVGEYFSENSTYSILPKMEVLKKSNEKTVVKDSEKPLLEKSENK